MAHATQADLCWYEVAYAQQAEGDAKWFFVQHETQADFKIFKTKYETQADLKIFKVKYPDKAGWRNTSHKLHGQLEK